MSTILEEPRMTGVLGHDIGVLSEKVRKLEEFNVATRSAVAAFHQEQWGLAVAYAEQAIDLVPDSLPNAYSQMGDFLRAVRFKKRKAEYDALPFWKKWFSKQPEMWD